MPKKGKTLASLILASAPKGTAVKSKGKAQGGKGQNGKSKMLFAPANAGMVTYSGRPRFSANNSHSITVSHREYIGDVLADTPFAVEYRLAINPGLDASFPWLGSIARKFESYTFKRLAFVYEPCCSSATAGSIYLAVDYDVNDSAPVTKSDITSYNGCVKSQAWIPNRLECDPRDIAKMAKERYTRGASVAAVADYKTYDVGHFILGTFGAVANNTLTGELFVEYTVELFTPQADVDFTSENSMKISADGVVSKTAPFGTVPALEGGLGVTVNAAGDTLTIPEVGEYLISYLVGGTGLTTTSPTVTVVAPDTYSPHFGSTPNAAGTLGQASWHFNAKQPNSTFKLDFTPGSTTVTGLTTSIARYLYSL